MDELTWTSGVLARRGPPRWSPMVASIISTRALGLLLSMLRAVVVMQFFSREYLVAQLMDFWRQHGVDKVMNALHVTDLAEDGQLEVEYFFRILQ